MDIIDRLRETAEEFKSIGHDADELHEACDEIERLRAERDALKQDAERYRCLRDPDCDQWSLPIMFSGDELDREIDRAMPLAGKE